ncbi:hypothetical protein ACFWIN_13775 [Streptomyces sp. NPDC127049]|uniref:hypothetical protein n=1 Tax=Streptomyces sp. NPDC127049 TaxID=3347118 RepID=UPI0036534A7C
MANGVDNGTANGPVACPLCGAAGTAAVAEATETSGCMHFAEGTVLALMAGAAGKYYADDRDWPWLTAVGAVVAVLLLVGTIAVVRGENRDARRARSAVDRAAAAGTVATHYCAACGEASSPETPRADGPATGRTDLPHGP